MIFNTLLQNKLALTFHYFISSLEAGDKLDAIVLDILKAFDRVPHKHYIRMNIMEYVRGITLQWLEDFLSGRIQQVK